MLQFLTYLFIAIYTATVIGIILVVILGNRNPLKTIPWVVVLIFAPVVGLVFYFFFGQNLSKRRIISRRTRKRITMQLEEPEHPEGPGIPPRYRPLASLLLNTLHSVPLYGSRIAVEFFHAVTDGTGGLIFLKTLVAEYLCQKYKINIPAENGVLGRLEDPDPEELEDSFLRYAGDITASRAEQTAYHMSGTPEPDGFLNLTTLMLPVPAVKEKAKEFGVSVTEFIAAVMMKAISDLQNEKVPRRMRRKPVKVLLPVNLRGLFPSRTMRNFASYVTPEIDPRLGDYSLAEICRIVHYRMGLENDPRMMAAKIATNVASERSAVLRVMPLFVKNIAMKAVFDLVGECKSCLCLSNLGLVRLPEEMAPYVARMDFIIGVQAKAPHNCGVVSWNGTMYINMIRNICEPELESHFYRVLHTLGLPVKVESNQRWA